MSEYKIEDVLALCDELNYSFSEQQYAHQEVVPDYLHLLSTETVMGETIVKLLGSIVVWDSVEDLRPERDGVKISLKEHLISETEGVYLGLSYFLSAEKNKEKSNGNYH